jgi:integrase
LESRTPELAPATVQAYRNELVHHLLPFFHKHRLSQITVAEVDRYREHKLREAEAHRKTLAAWERRCAKLKPADLRPPRPASAMLAASYINATITRLGMILDVADERGLIDRNPVRVNPRRRKVKASNARRAYLDRPDQIVALLEAAAKLDRAAANRRDRDTCLRRPLIALLIFGGLRISEALALRWRDVDLAGSRLRVRDSGGKLGDENGRPRRSEGAKTDAGVRWVPIFPALRDELVARKASTEHAGPDQYVFTTRTGRSLSRDNTRTRILAKAHELTDEALLQADLAPLPERLTQHSLRHTHISLRVALGDDPATIAHDAGHADMSVTFRIYTHVMRLQEGDRERLRALVDGIHWAPLGTNAGSVAREAGARAVPETTEARHLQGFRDDSWGETRTPDLTIMSRAL